MKQYKYEMKWWFIIVCVIFSVPITCFSYHEASNNNRGLIINGLIELSPFSATIFYWGLFICCFLFTFLSLFGVYSKLQGSAYILINHEKISIPPIGIFQKEPTNILFCSIESISEQTINGNVMLFINYQGKKSIIQKHMLQKSEYLEIRDLLASKITST